MTKSDPKKEKSQADKFREMARQLEANESQEDFTVVLKRVAKVPHSKQVKSQPKKPGR